MADQQPGDLTGITIASQFHILRKLGEGGMGSVYLAEQIDMGRRVVVKVMHPELTAGSSTAVERFKREARAVAQLNHPNIVQVYVFGQTETGQLYLAMEFVDGRDLTADLKRGAMPQARALRVLDQVAAALSEAHNAGIVHRDLKPDNIMLTDRHGNPDYVKVLDFGIAKMVGDKNMATLTQAGAVFGTPRYMAPEQATGKPVDARTDIYALGIILYEMITGSHPFRADSAVEYLVKHTTEDAVMPGQLGLDIQIIPRVDSIVARCMRKDPAERFQSAVELQRAIRTALRDFPESVREFPTPYQDPVAPAPSARGGARAGRAVETERVPGHAPHERGARRGGRGVLMGGIAAALVAAGGVGAYLLAGHGEAKPSRAEVSAQAAALVKEVAASLHGDKPALPGPGAGVQPGAGSGPAPGVKAGAAPGVKAGAAPDVKAGTAPAQAPPRQPAVQPEAAPAPPSPPPPGGAAPAPPKLAVGERVDGFPLPKGARVSMTTPQAVMLESSADAEDLLAFFRAHVTELYGAPSTIPNGIQVPAGKAPFSYITLMNSPSGEGIMVVLTRNVLFKKAATGTELQDAFGVAIMPGGKVFMRTAQVVSVRTRKPAAEVFDFYENLYGKGDGVTLVRQDDNDPPVMSINTTNKSKPWQSISIVGDPSNPGSLLVNVMKR